MVRPLKCRARLPRAALAYLLVQLSCWCTRELPEPTAGKAWYFGRVGRMRTATFSRRTCVNTDGPSPLGHAAVQTPAITSPAPIICTTGRPVSTWQNEHAPLQCKHRQRWICGQGLEC